MFAIANPTHGGAMKLTLEEQYILQDLAEKVISPVKRGPRPLDYDERKQERLDQYRKVGDLINRYELWLEENWVNH